MHIPKRLPTTLDSTSAFEVETYLAETAEFAVARSTVGEVGVTWNPDQKGPQGFPHTYGHHQWFILPEQIAAVLLANAELFDGQ